MSDDSIGKQELGIISALLLIFGLLSAVGLFAFVVGDSYNQLVDKDIKAMQMKANIQTSLEQRADLIPNIVNTISASAKFEKNTLIDVVKERNNALSIKNKVSSSETIEQLQSESDNIDSTLGRLLVICEQYPQLKTTDQFLNMQTQLSTLENQLRIDRANYNKAVADYQQTTRVFPINIFAGIFHFDTYKWKTFESGIGSENVPEVNYEI